MSRFVYGTRINVPEYLEKNGTTYRLVTDHLGSVRLVIDTTTDTVVQALTYDPWGVVVQDTNPGFQPFGYAGGLYDHRTGLVRFGVRDYDAAIGRWLAKDPLGFEGGDSSIYAYALGDPIAYYDPSGLLCFSFEEFATQVERERLDLIATLGTLLATEGLGTMPKALYELRAFGPRDQMNPFTSQLSRWSSRMGIRALREAGRCALGVAIGGASTAALVFEGFYDWTVIIRSAISATSGERCGCSAGR